MVSKAILDQPVQLEQTGLPVIPGQQGLQDLRGKWDQLVSLVKPVILDLPEEMVLMEKPGQVDQLVLKEKSARLVRQVIQGQLVPMGLSGLQGAPVTQDQLVHPVI
jgi:hypothetical protein